MFSFQSTAETSLCLDISARVSFEDREFLASFFSSQSWHYCSWWYSIICSTHSTFL